MRRREETEDGVGRGAGGSEEGGESRERPITPPAAFWWSGWEPAGSSPGRGAHTRLREHVVRPGAGIPNWGLRLRKYFETLG